MHTGEERRVLNGGSSSMHEEETSSLRRSSSVKQQNAEGSHARTLKRYASQSSLGQGVQVGSTGTVFSLIGQEDRSRPHRAPQQQRQHQQQLSQFRSKSVSWKDPMMYLQRIGSRRAPVFIPSKAARSYRQQPKPQSLRKDASPERKKPSAWARLLKKLGLDGGKKVHAARADWLNYDAQSYAMNFEKDRETQSSSSYQMPKISGPGAREIVTVLLQRTSSMNRNSGSILIPKPVPHITSKAEMSTPLWKRRSVNAPSSLDLHRFRPSAIGRARRGSAV
ncbi:hypothetical protein Mapa_001450 [Marchantia paleacea]|nr:hypothetical protein Mapa_001450 [Marchantia paleacea]